ncbi:MAG: penicillin-insensitive murein endopeptidase [Myxococcota bacterium]|nr:penicillin-insensitive murein endopeptidase [Myxococcota bacterium]
MHASLLLGLLLLAPTTAAAPFPRCPPLPGSEPARPPGEPPWWGLAGSAAPEPRPSLPRDPLGAVSRDSTSLGAANGGELHKAARLPRRGPHHRVLPGREGRRHGTTELVGLLQHAAREVATVSKGSVLGVGNLSLPRGGRIPVSVSHQSGRDADLSFYFLEERTGRPVLQPRWRRCAADGRTGDRRYRFDARRNWRLVQALLTYPAAGVQWIFVSSPLRELLLAEARAQGAPPELQARAAVVLRQPLGSLPHDDHFHVRIHCSPDDLLDGCREFGPWRPWVPFPATGWSDRLAALRRVLDDPAGPLPRRRAALRRLVALGDRRAAPSLVQLLEVGPPALRLPAVQAARGLAAVEAAAAVARHLVPEAPRDLLAAGLDTLEALGDPAVAVRLLPLAVDGRLLPRTGGQPRRSVGERALEVVGRLAAPAAASGLVALLDRPDLPREVRSRALQALQRIAVAAPDLPPGEPRGAAWARWLAAHPLEPRESRLLAGLAEAGYPLPAGLCAPASVPRLIPALRDPRPHVSENARDLVRGCAGLPPWRPGDRHLGPAFWQAWWERVGEPASRRGAAGEPRPAGEPESPGRP